MAPGGSTFSKTGRWRPARLCSLLWTLALQEPWTLVAKEPSPAGHSTRARPPQAAGDQPVFEEGRCCAGVPPECGPLSDPATLCSGFVSTFGHLPQACERHTAHCPPPPIRPPHLASQLLRLSLDPRLTSPMSLMRRLVSRSPRSWPTTCTRSQRSRSWQDMLSLRQVPVFPVRAKGRDIETRLCPPCAACCPSRSDQSVPMLLYGMSLVQYSTSHD